MFIETDIREQQKHDKRMNTSVDIKVNDLCHEIKFENRVKDKYNFLLSKTFIFFWNKNVFLFLEKYFFKIPKKSIALAFFLWRQILKNIDTVLKIKILHVPASWSLQTRSGY